MCDASCIKEKNVTGVISEFAESSRRRARRAGNQWVLHPEHTLCVWEERQRRGAPAGRPSPAQPLSLPWQAHSWQVQGAAKSRGAVG